MRASVFLSVWLAALSALAAPSDLRVRVTGYLLQGGKDPDAVASADAFALVRQGGVSRIGRWDAAAVGLPEPSETDLPSLAEAQALVAARNLQKESDAAAAAAAAESARQAAKSDKLKAAENALVAYAVSEGAPAMTADGLDAMFAGWEASLNDAQLWKKSTKYDRLLKAVERRGGSELDARAHP